MTFEEFEKALTQEERDQINERVVAEMFPHLPKRRNRMKKTDFIEVIEFAGFEVVEKDFSTHIRQKAGHVNYLVATISNISSGSFDTKTVGFERLTYHTRYFLIKAISCYSLTPVAERNSDAE